MFLLNSSYWPFFKNIGLPSIKFPVLISGPFVSNNIETCLLGLSFKAVWTPCICPRCSAWSPWEKFNLATDNP